MSLKQGLLTRGPPGEVLLLHEGRLAAHPAPHHHQGPGLAPLGNAPTAPGTMLGYEWRAGRRWTNWRLNGHPLPALASVLKVSSTLFNPNIF